MQELEVQLDSLSTKKNHPEWTDFIHNMKQQLTFSRITILSQQNQIPRNKVVQKMDQTYWSKVKIMITEPKAKKSARNLEIRAQTTLKLKFHTKTYN